MSHEELLARHRQVMPSWLALYYDQPIELVDGKGCRVVDGEGNSYLDFFGGILVTMVGYNLPEVVEAVRDQAGRMVHTSTLYLIRQQVELAERIAALSGIPDAKVFFTNSGTEANEAALLLATTARRSNQVLALRNSYHGRSFSTIGITGNSAWSPTSLSPFQTYYVHGGQRVHSPFAGLSDADFIAACVADLEDVLDQTGGSIAALIAEPIQGVGGFTSGPDGLLGAFAEVLRARDILWISDEVQTGWGRTGEHFWGWQAHGATPDIVTFAKGVGNGLSMGGVIAPASLMDDLPANSISTFGGSPITSAGALANLRHLREHDLQGNAAKVGPILLDGLRALDLPHVVDVRGKGLMIGVELDTAARAAAVLQGCRDRGLLVGKGGLRGNVLRIAPPLSLTADEAHEGLAILVGALS
jgi:4-aminobutyrate aminotransferase